VQFALKLITEQYAGQFQQEVIACLNHSLKTVRHQAIICLGELPSQNVASALRTHYATETSKELQLSILSGLIKAGSADDIPFLEALLLTPDHCVQLMASKTLLNLQQQTFK
jgi:HEAT repeat protein